MSKVPRLNLKNLQDRSVPCSAASSPRNPPSSSASSSRKTSSFDCNAINSSRSILGTTAPPSADDAQCTPRASAKPCGRGTPATPRGENSGDFVSGSGGAASLPNLTPRHSTPQAISQAEASPGDLSLSSEFLQGELEDSDGTESSDSGFNSARSASASTVGQFSEWPQLTVTSPEPAALPELSSPSLQTPLPLAFARPVKRSSQKGHFRQRRKQVNVVKSVMQDSIRQATETGRNAQDLQSKSGKRLLRVDSPGPTDYRPVHHFPESPRTSFPQATRWRETSPRDATPGPGSYVPSPQQQPSSGSFVAPAPPAQAPFRRVGQASQRSRKSPRRQGGQDVELQDEFSRPMQEDLSRNGSMSGQYRALYPNSSPSGSMAISEAGSRGMLLPPGSAPGTSNSLPRPIDQSFSGVSSNSSFGQSIAPLLPQGPQYPRMPISVQPGMQGLVGMPMGYPPMGYPPGVD